MVFQDYPAIMSALLVSLAVSLFPISSMADWGQPSDSYQNQAPEQYPSRPPQHQHQHQHNNEKRYEVTGIVSPSFPSIFSVQRRDVPEALIDPYSVLGMLSFGVYISYILYHRYQMANKKKDTAPSGTPAVFSAPSSDQNLAYLLEVAAKILQNAEKHGAQTEGGKQNTNGTTAPVLDYYDDNDPIDLKQTPAK